ncbi:UDP-glycosyltransferase 73C3 [Morella rubra]|uniref:Glycosyltransferase n=1 Tax=Morella rubra TaxID=262757 RepID=A0A6A1WB11_9ROSI|nr:UDP-glycosyltransferase 73C3 [Morella rubra]
MASQSPQLHFLLIPFVVQSRLIPMIDIAKILAQRNVVVSIVTAPLNATGFNTTINRAVKSGLPVRIIPLELPHAEADLLNGFENDDSLSLPNMMKNFTAAMSMLQKPLEELFEELKPRPSCIISDRNLMWTTDVAHKFHIPRIAFDGKNCFHLLCSHNLRVSKVFESVSNSEDFVVPGLPHQIAFTKAQLPPDFNPGSNWQDMDAILEKIREAEAGSYGLLVNSYDELELAYLQEYRKRTGKKVWCIGPVSLCNKDNSDKAERGKKASIDENQCLKWLDSCPPGSVIYVCLGSLSRLTPPQLIELGLGLEASKRPFIWVIRSEYKREELEKWLVKDGFEERVKGRGFLIRGWAPQVLILSHPAIGGFLTHCGWNSTLEGICAGLPMITWPMFSEQFLNEKLIVQVLEIGVRVGVEVAVQLGEEEKFGVLVKRENVKEAIDKVMGEGKEKEERRERVRKLSEMARKAVEVGGSSYQSITLLLEDIMQQAQKQSEHSIV